MRVQAAARSVASGGRSIAASPSVSGPGAPGDVGAPPDPPCEIAPAAADPPAPAVSIRKSVTPDYLICLEDGKRFKSLRRHLGALGMTPEQYRVKWDLPSTYPMVAPNYAAQRSAMAKKIGLGRTHPARSVRS